MGVYKRKDSPYYWLLIERKNKIPIMESSRIMVDTGSSALDEKNRLAARIKYAERFQEVTDAEVLAAKAQRRLVTRDANHGWAYIYFLKQANAIKIGRAINVTRRLRELSVGAKEPFELLAAVPAHSSVEAALHAKFKKDQIRGEWFTATPELEALIADVRAGLDVATAVFQLR
jgi:hypothetical protein